MDHNSSDDARRKSVFLHPRGYGAPPPIIDETCEVVFVNDSEVGRDMCDVEGPGGPDSFELDARKLLAEANKVIVAVGGPSLLLRDILGSAVRDKGYVAVVDVPSSRFPAWAQMACEVRGGQKGLALIGPRSLLPLDLRERCVADIDNLPSTDAGLFRETAH